MLPSCSVQQPHTGMGEIHSWVKMSVRGRREGGGGKLDDLIELVERSRGRERGREGGKQR